MSFKDRVNRDIGKVFLDTRFFAENRTIRYDGEEYPDIPVSLQETGEDERQPKADDHAQGFYPAQCPSRVPGWKSTARRLPISLNVTG